MNEEKQPDWVYMLKTSVYLTLLGVPDSNGHSLPCKIREQTEDKIVKKFEKLLQERGYEIVKKHNP